MSSIQTISIKLFNDYETNLSNFLEEVWYLENMENKELQDYLSIVKENKSISVLENMVKGITENIQEDGEIHLEEYDEHLKRSETIIEESYPLEETYMMGPPFSTNYSELSLDSYIDQIPNEKLSLFLDKMIGVCGKEMVKITNMSGVHYIWYTNREKTMGIDYPGKDRNSHIIQIWGVSERIYCAIELLKQHINMIILKIKFNSNINSEIIKNIELSKYNIEKINQEKIGLLLGKKGINLKTIKKKSDVNNLWYNRETNCIEIKSYKKDNVNYAIMLVKKLINRMENNVIKENKLIEFNMDLNNYNIDRNNIGIMGLIIGKKGVNLKNIKKQSRVIKLWYNKETHNIEIKSFINENIENARILIEGLLFRMNSWVQGQSIHYY